MSLESMTSTADVHTSSIEQDVDCGVSCTIVVGVDMLTVRPTQSRAEVLSAI